MTALASANPRAAALRSAVLRLVVSVVVLDAVALAIYFAADVRGRPVNAQHAFVGVWLAVTLLVVLDGLKRVREARGAPR